MQAEPRFSGGERSPVARPPAYNRQHNTNVQLSAGGTTRAKTSLEGAGPHSRCGPVVTAGLVGRLLGTAHRGVRALSRGGASSARVVRLRLVRSLPRERRRSGLRASALRTMGTRERWMGGRGRSSRERGRRVLHSVCAAGCGAPMEHRRRHRGPPRSTGDTEDLPRTPSNARRSSRRFIFSMRVLQ